MGGLCSKQKKVVIRGLLLVALGVLIITALLIVERFTNPSVHQLELTSTNVIIPDIKTHSTFSKQAVLNPVPAEFQGTQGPGLGFARPTDLQIPPFDRPQTEEFELAEGIPFAPFLILLNRAEQPVTLLVVALLDYEQVPFELDDKTGLLHEVVVPSATELNLPLHLQIAGAGMHDLALVAFVNPYSHPLDIDTRANELGNIVGRRTVVVVGEQKDPFKVLAPVIVGEDPPPNLASIPIRVGLAAAPDKQLTHPSERQIVLSEAHPAQEFPYQVWATNFNQDVPVDYAMIGFLDFHQVDLSQPHVTVVNLGVGQEAIINASVTMPDRTGIHEIQVIYMLDPYKSILQGQVATPFIFSTPRLGVDTR